jgi:hypothetical protein
MNIKKESGGVTATTQRSASMPRATLATLMLAVFTVSVGFSVVLPLLPYLIERLLGAGVEAAQISRHTGLLTAVYTFSLFLFAPMWGRLSDRRGARAVLLVGLLGFGVSMLGGVSCSALYPVSGTWGGPDIDDLRLESVSLVDSQPILKAAQEDRGNRLDRKMLKVEVSSEHDLGKVAYETELNLSFNPTLCHQDFELASWPSIFYKNFIINSIYVLKNRLAEYKDDIAKKPKHERYHYYVLIDYKGKSFTKGATPGKPYDLSIESHDVCLSFQGFSMVPFGGFFSNDLVIPKQTINEALNEVIK